MSTWPETVPHYIVRGSFALVAPSRPPHRTEYEDGLQRARRSSTKNIATVSFDLSLTPDELQAFVAFERDTLIDGTQSFTMPIRIAGGVYDERACSFREPYRARAGRGHLTTVSLVLDVEDWGAPPIEGED